MECASIEARTNLIEGSHTTGLGLVTLHVMLSRFKSLKLRNLGMTLGKVLVPELMVFGTAASAGVSRDIKSSLGPPSGAPSLTVSSPAPGLRQTWGPTLGARSKTPKHPGYVRDDL